MTDVNSIRKTFFLEGKNVAEIARATGHDVKTVIKYIDKENFSTEVKLKEKRPSKLDSYKPIIDEWLTNDLNAKRKQRHTAKRVFERLLEHCKNNLNKEFECSYRLVGLYVSDKKKELYTNKNNAFLPLEHIPGEAQVDFGNADFFENGVKYEGSYLCMSFPQSNGGYIQLVKGQNQECLFEGMQNIFEHIGGVPYRIWFDNMSTAVVKILKEGKRVLTQGFLAFKNHYGFEAAFCNPDAGNEKGNVENKVGYLRRNMLVPIPEFTEINDYNKELLNRCDADMKRNHYSKGSQIKDLFELDKNKLLKLNTNKFEAAKYMEIKTNGYAKFTLENGKHTYSTQPSYANSKIIVKITANEVIAMNSEYKVIQKHKRLYGNSLKQSMDWLPYLTQLATKPRALKYTGIYDMLPDSVKGFLDNCQLSEQRKLLKTLSELTASAGFEEAIEALEYAVKNDIVDMDSIVAVFRRINSLVPDIVGFDVPNSVPEVEKVSVDTSKYDCFLHQGGARD